MSFNPMASGASGVGRKGECTLLYSGELWNKQTRGNAERNRRVDRAIVGVVASEPRCGGGRRGGGASWYDSRDRGGESVGELAGGGRVEGGSQVLARARRVVFQVAGCLWLSMGGGGGNNKGKGRVKAQYLAGPAVP